MISGLREVYKNHVVGYGDADGVAWAKGYPAGSNHGMWIFLICWAVFALYVLFNIKSFPPAIGIMAVTSWIAWIPWTFWTILGSLRLQTGNSIRKKLKELGYSETSNLYL